MAYFRYRNRNKNNNNRVRFNQPFSFRRREKVQVNELPLNMIISEPASRDHVPQYSNLKECLANSGATSTKTDPVRQEVSVDVLNNYPNNTQNAETEKNHCTQTDSNITFNYREDINYDRSSTSCSESWSNDKSFFSSGDRSPVNLESHTDVCPDRRRNLQQTESDILNNINYKNYVPRVLPFLAFFSPKNKKIASLSQPNYEANKVTDEYSDLQPYFEWSKQNLSGQKRRHEFEGTDPLCKVSKKVESRVGLDNLSPSPEHIVPASDTSIEFAWKSRIIAKENTDDDPADITFLYKSFNRLPYSSPVNATNSSFQFTPNIELEE